jgi:hypothetical protein
MQRYGGPCDDARDFCLPSAGVGAPRQGWTTPLSWRGIGWYRLFYFGFKQADLASS